MSWLYVDCETGVPLEIPSLLDIPVATSQPVTSGPDTTITPPTGLKEMGTSIGVYVVVVVVIVVGLTTIYVCVRLCQTGPRVGHGANGDRITITVGVDGQRLVQAKPTAPLATSTIQSR